MKPPVLLIPGIGNSGPDHWQTLWEMKYPNTKRVQQSDWDNPDCKQWAEQLERAVRSVQVPPVLVAHSLGCLVVCRWASMSRLAIKAALLVAVPDPTGPSFPKEAKGFGYLHPEMNARKIVMVSSSSDPFSTPSYTKQQALAWNAVHVELGAKGHINAASGLGEWNEGWKIVERLLAD